MKPEYEIFLTNNCKNNCVFYKGLVKNTEIDCKFPFLKNPQIEEFEHFQRLKNPTDWQCYAFKEKNKKIICIIK